MPENWRREDTWTFLKLYGVGLLIVVVWTYIVLHFSTHPAMPK